MFTPVCGSDGNTYSSACQLRLISCILGIRISIRGEGACGEWREGQGYRGARSAVEREWKGRTPDGFGISASGHVMTLNKCWWSLTHSCFGINRNCFFRHGDDARHVHHGGDARPAHYGGALVLTAVHPHLPPGLRQRRHHLQQPVSLGDSRL